MSIEDMIPDTKVVVTISHAGYLKRTNLDEYKVQNRGGRGQKGATTRNEDFLEHLFVVQTTNTCYSLLKKEKYSGCVCMKFQKEVKIPKEEQCKT